MALPMSGTALDDVVPRDEIVLQPPPMLPKAGGGPGGQQLLYMLLPTVGMGSMSALYLGRGGSGPLTWVIVGVSALGLVGMVVMTLLRGGAQKKVQINDERRDYLRYLTGLRGKVREAARRQADDARTRLPAPEDLWMAVGTDRMWRRRPGDADFARVRVAIGPQLLATPLRVPETAPLEDLDPVSSAALRRFVSTHATVPGLPVAVSLRSFGRVTIDGDRTAVLGLARAMLAQLATFHSLEAQAKKFQGLARELAENVGLSAKNYMANNAAGAERIGRLAGLAETGGTTFNRLVPGSSA